MTGRSNSHQISSWTFQREVAHIELFVPGIMLHQLKAIANGIVSTVDDGSLPININSVGIRIARVDLEPPPDDSGLISFDNGLTHNLLSSIEVEFHLHG